MEDNLDHTGQWPSAAWDVGSGTAGGWGPQVSPSPVSSCCPQIPACSRTTWLSSSAWTPWAGATAYTCTCLSRPGRGRCSTPSCGSWRRWVPRGRGGLPDSARRVPASQTAPRGPGGRQRIPGAWARPGRLPHCPSSASGRRHLGTRPGALHTWGLEETSVGFLGVSLLFSDMGGVGRSSGPSAGRWGAAGPGRWGLGDPTTTPPCRWPRTSSQSCASPWCTRRSTWRRTCWPGSTSASPSAGCRPSPCPTWRATAPASAAASWTCGERSPAAPAGPAHKARPESSLPGRGTGGRDPAMWVVGGGRRGPGSGPRVTWAAQQRCWGRWRLSQWPGVPRAPCMPRAPELPLRLRPLARPLGPPPCSPHPPLSPWCRRLWVTLFWELTAHSSVLLGWQPSWWPRLPNPEPGLVCCALFGQPWATGYTLHLTVGCYSNSALRGGRAPPSPVPGEETEARGVQVDARSRPACRALRATPGVRASGHPPCPRRPRRFLPVSPSAVRSPLCSGVFWRL